MFASTIGVDARIEPDVGAIVAGDDRTRGVSQENRCGPWLLVRLPGLRLDLDALKAILGVARRSATDDAPSILFWLPHQLILNAFYPTYYTFSYRLEYEAESKSFTSCAWYPTEDIGRPPPLHAPS